MTKSSPLALQTDALSFFYRQTPVLSNLSISIPQGVLLGILGPNGAGKTTLMKILLGLLRPTSGSLSLLGKERKQVQKRLSYVPQKGNVDWDFPANVFEVVLMGRYGHLGWIKRPLKRDREIALEALEQVDLIDLRHRHIRELSGGQQQRVFLARALAQQGDLYFMDEPFAAIDRKTERTLIRIFQSLQREGKTLFIIHHDLHTVREYFDWVYFLNVSTLALGPTQEIFTEENIKRAYHFSYEELASLSHQSQ